MSFVHILYCSALVLLVYANKFERRDHSLSAPYTGGWTSYGTTMFTPSVVRLTSDQRGAAAGLSNIYKLYARDWEIVIDFKVHGSRSSLFGDGFAFWYTAEPVKMGDPMVTVNTFALVVSTWFRLQGQAIVGGTGDVTCKHIPENLDGNALGGSETFRGLGIFFDTYSNHNGEHVHEHPYVSAMVNSGSVTYDHDTDGTQTQLAGCHSPFRNKQHKTKASITYLRNTLTVKMDIKGENIWTDCFEVKGVHLPTGYFLGLSAATGDLTDTHDIYSLKTYDLGVSYTGEEALEDRQSIVPSAEFAESPRERVPDTPRSSLWTIFFYIFLFVFLVAVGLVGYIYYRANQRRSKRLF